MDPAGFVLVLEVVPVVSLVTVDPFASVVVMVPVVVLMTTLVVGVSGGFVDVDDVKYVEPFESVVVWTMTVVEAFDMGRVDVLDVR